MSTNRARRRSWASMIGRLTWRAARAMWIVGAIPTVVILRVWVFFPCRLISGSMEPTLRAGDFCLVNRLSYRSRQPAPGEIVALYTKDRQQLWIKRVVAGPGDVVQVRGGFLWRNGQKVEEPYCSVALPTPRSSELHARDLYLNDGELPDPEARNEPLPDYGPARVPAGHVFVLGDNRNSSNDSRIWGPLHPDYLVGRLVLLYWPRERARRLD